MTDKEKAIEAVGFLAGLHEVIRRECAKEIVESYDKAVEDVRTYVVSAPYKYQFGTEFPYITLTGSNDGTHFESPVDCSPIVTCNTSDEVHA